MVFIQLINQKTMNIIKYIMLISFGLILINCSNQNTVENKMLKNNNSIKRQINKTNISNSNNTYDEHYKWKASNMLNPADLNDSRKKDFKKYIKNAENFIKKYDKKENAYRDEINSLVNNDLKKIKEFIINNYPNFVSGLIKIIYRYYDSLTFDEADSFLTKIEYIYNCDLFIENKSYYIKKHYKNGKNETLFSFLGYEKDLKSLKKLIDIEENPHQLALNLIKSSLSGHVPIESVRLILDSIKLDCSGILNNYLNKDIPNYRYINSDLPLLISLLIKNSSCFSSENNNETFEKLYEKLYDDSDMTIMELKNLERVTNIILKTETSKDYKFSNVISFLKSQVIKNFKEIITLSSINFTFIYSVRPGTKSSNSDKNAVLAFLFITICEICLLFCLPLFLSYRTMSKINITKYNLILLAFGIGLPWQVYNSPPIPPIILTNPLLCKFVVCLWLIMFFLLYMMQVYPIIKNKYEKYKYNQRKNHVL